MEETNLSCDDTQPDPTGSSLQRHSDDVVPIASETVSLNIIRWGGEEY